MQVKKFVLHSTDVAVLMDVSTDTARRMLKKVKDAYAKKEHQSVTIREFCDYEGLPYEEVFDMLNGHTSKRTA